MFRKITVLCFCSKWLLLFSATAEVSDVDSPKSVSAISYQSFQLAYDKQLITDIQNVGGAIIADPRYWHSTYVIKKSGVRASCSATLIAPNVMVTAAHCVPNSKDIDIVSGDSRTTAKCTHNPIYDPHNNPQNDLALCLLKKRVEAHFYGVVDVVFEDGEIGKSVVLTGVGCSHSDRSGNDGLLRYGSAEIISLYTQFGEHIVVWGGAFLCPGDSGGATYRLNGYQLSERSSRRVIGINSKVLIDASSGSLSRQSFVVPFNSLENREFIKKWSRDNGAKICGLDFDDKRCGNR